jgi:hypothetical protein
MLKSTHAKMMISPVIILVWTGIDTKGSVGSIM